MSKIVVEGNRSACSRVDSVIQHLNNCSSDKISRVIRIGGDERWFDGSRDSVTNLHPVTNGLEFDCNDSAYPTVIGILKHLEKLSVDKISRAIRIGGYEYKFDGTVDEINTITVDGTLNTDVYVSAGRLNGRPSRARRSSNPAPVATKASATGLTDDQIETIQDTVTEKIRNSEMFTAFDVTKKVRADGMRVFHNQVKEVVADMLQDIINSGYTRNVVVLPFGQSAFVYHLVGSNANDYVNIGQNQPV